MWDESALKTEGYDDVAAVLAKARGDEPAAATSRDIKGSDDSKVITAQARRPATTTSSAPRRSAGPSWALTLALAAAAAVAVYFLVRYLR